MPFTYAILNAKKVNLNAPMFTKIVFKKIISQCLAVGIGHLKKAGNFKNYVQPFYEHKFKVLLIFA